jgi:hypothetical protein
MVAQARTTIVKAADIGADVWSGPGGTGIDAWSPDGRSIAVPAPGGLSIFRIDGVSTAALTGCTGTVTGVVWTGSAIAAATDLGWLCSWQAPVA